jgi:hypothetical protein
MTMKRAVVLFFVSGLFYVLLSSHQNGVATVQSKDRTGSPVGQAQQCGQCHTGGTMPNPAISIRLKDASNNSVTSYIPGETYTLEVELSSAGAAGFGFQTVGLLASNNAQAGTLTAQSANAKIKVLNSRTYGEQNGNSLGNGLFVLTWVAPEPGSGTVKFYAAGQANNDNNDDTFDKAVTGTPITITEDISGSIAETTNNWLALFPNPGNGTIQITAPENGTHVLSVYNLQGQLQLNHLLNGSEGTQMQADLSSLSTGVYVVVLSSANGQRTGRYIRI